MALPHDLRQIAVRVAKHEVGHNIIARALGFRTGDVSIKILRPHGRYHGASAITLPEAIEAIEDLRVYLERRIIVLYAGALAETLPDSGSPTKKVNADKAHEILENPVQGAEQDFAKVRELLYVLRNVSRPGTDLSDEDALQAEINELNHRLFNRAAELVEAYAETIIGLGDNLASQVKAVGEIVILKADYLGGLRGVRQIEPTTP